MKFDYSFNLSEWFNSKAGLIFSLVIETLLLISVSFEIYTGDSDFMLMVVLATYLIGEFFSNYKQLKDLKGK